MSGRDHRDDAQPMACVVWGVPISLGAWAIGILMGFGITAVVTR